MEREKWLLCPICKSKTRVKVRDDTELTNFPLFCPKCKQESLVNVKQLNMSIIKELPFVTFLLPHDLLASYTCSFPYYGRSP